MTNKDRQKPRDSANFFFFFFFILCVCVTERDWNIISYNDREKEDQEEQKASSKKERATTAIRRSCPGISHSTKNKKKRVPSSIEMLLLLFSPSIYIVHANYFCLNTIQPLGWLKPCSCQHKGSGYKTSRFVTLIWVLVFPSETHNIPRLKGKKCLLNMNT